MLMHNITEVQTRIFEYRGEGVEMAEPLAGEGKLGCLVATVQDQVSISALANYQLTLCTASFVPFCSETQYQDLSLKVPYMI